MFDYAAARNNMVDCQIQTSGVTNPAILDAFRKVPREKFIPESLRSVAFADEDLALPNNDFLIEPLVFSRMLQVIQPKPEDIVLNIGDPTGYCTAILSHLVSTVVALETRMREFDAAKPVWSSMDCCNIAVISGSSVEGCPSYAPYDLIVINGAVANVPSAILGQLGEQGKLVTVIRPQARQAGCITLIARDGDQAFSVRRTYDAGTPYLKGFEPVSAFIF